MAGGLLSFLGPVGEIVGVATGLKSLLGGGGPSAPAAPAQPLAGLTQLTPDLMQSVRQLQQWANMPTQSTMGLQAGNEYQKLLNQLTGQLRASGLRGSSYSRNEGAQGAAGLAGALQNATTQAQQAQYGRQANLAQLLQALVTGQGQQMAQGYNQQLQQAYLNQQYQNQQLQAIQNLAYWLTQAGGGSGGGSTPGYTPPYVPQPVQYDVGNLDTSPAYA